MDLDWWMDFYFRSDILDALDVENIDKIRCWVRTMMVCVWTLHVITHTSLFDQHRLSALPLSHSALYSSPVSILNSACAVVVDGASFIDNSRRCVMRALTRTGDVETIDDVFAVGLDRGLRVLFDVVLILSLHLEQIWVWSACWVWHAFSSTRYGRMRTSRGHNPLAGVFFDIQHKYLIFQAQNTKLNTWNEMK